LVHHIRPRLIAVRARQETLSHSVSDLDVFSCEQPHPLRSRQQLVRRVALQDRPAQLQPGYEQESRAFGEFTHR
jgi:hypothetical protein